MRPSHILKVENDWRARLATALGRELALRKEVEALRAEAGTLVQRIAEGVAENERLWGIEGKYNAVMAEAQAWRQCALYDAMMEGPAFKGWDRSALDRCRKRFCEQVKE